MGVVQLSDGAIVTIKSEKDFIDLIESKLGMEVRDCYTSIISDYTGTIEDLQEEIKSLEEEIDDLEGEIDALEDKLSTK